MPSYSSTLIIEELTGGKRILRLVGAGLPFQGAEWAGENNLITTWYPGNGAEATQQILGPRELPSTWNGEWNRTRLARSPCVFTDENGADAIVVAPQILRAAFESLFRAGQRLRVTWAVEGDAPSSNDNIVREGRAKTWKFQHDRPQDIKWTVEFHWQSRGGVKQLAVSTRDESLAAGGTALSIAAADTLGLIKQQEKLKESKRSKLKLPTHWTLGQLESVAKYPLAVTNSFSRSLLQFTSTLRDLGSVAATVRGLPFAMANSAASAAWNSISVANNFIDQMGRRPPELNSLRNTVRSTVRAAQYFGEVTDSSRLLARRAMQFHLDFMRMTANVNLAGKQSARSASSLTTAKVNKVHVCHEGDTPQRLSMKYYGTPDHAVDILKANKLPWHQSSLKVGKVLIIPQLDTASATSSV